MGKKLDMTQAQILINKANQTQAEENYKQLDIDNYIHNDNDVYKLKTKKNLRNVNLQCLLDKETSDLLKSFAKAQGTSKNEVVIQAIRKFINEFK